MQKFANIFHYNGFRCKNFPLSRREGIRTLGAVTPTSLAGRHNKPLCHPSRSPLAINFGEQLAERVGLEPTRAFTPTVFKTATHRPTWFTSPCCGQGGIRTPEAERQEGYNLPVLTTYLPTQISGIKKVLTLLLGLS